MICPKCGSDRVNTQVVSTVETKRRGCIGWIMWIIYTVLIGWIMLLIAALTNSKSKTKTKVMAICQACGNSWKV